MDVVKDGLRAERRSASRRRVHFPVVEGRYPWCVETRSLDLSPTGIQLERTMAPSHPPHAIVPVAMHLPGRPEPLRASASLVWSQGNRAGYEFVAMTDEDRLEIEQTMARARQDEVAPLVQSFAVRSRGTR